MTIYICMCCCFFVGAVPDTSGKPATVGNPNHSMAHTFAELEDKADPTVPCRSGKVTSTKSGQKNHNNKSSQKAPEGECPLTHQDTIKPRLD